RLEGAELPDPARDRGSGEEAGQQERSDQDGDRQPPAQVARQAGRAGQGSGELAGEIARVRDRRLRHRPGDLLAHRGDAPCAVRSYVDRVDVTLEALALGCPECLRAGERDVDVRRVAAGRLADNTYDAEFRLRQRYRAADLELGGLGVVRVQQRD